MVDPELFEDYRRAMETVARLAHDATSALVADIDPFGDPTQNALRLLAGYPEIVARYGTVAVTAAREYYERSRELAVEAGEIEGDDGYEAVDAPTVRREWAEEDVRKAAGEGIDLLAGEAVRRVMQRGDQTIAMNAMRDPAHPMWAIVPHAGACGWCVMVASNGWAYSSERSANAQRHANCKCTVAVDFDLGNPSLRGYDPDALYGRYRRGIADAGGEGGIRARWDALSPEERAGYKRKGRSAYDVFKTKEITKAMDAAAGGGSGRAWSRSRERGERLVTGSGGTYRPPRGWSQLITSEGESTIPPERDFANSLRQPSSRILTDSEMASILDDATSIEIPIDILRFNNGTQTAFVDATGTINIRGDILPDATSSENRDRMTSRAVLAHEYYGHAQFPDSGFEPGHWADEFRASYRAAIDTPNLSDEERASLMVDAYERAADAGVRVRYNERYREVVYGYS